MIMVFAPATSANIGPGFDLLGVAIDGLGDRVTVRRRRLPGVVIEHIEGDDGQLPREANKNTAGIAARETLRLRPHGSTVRQRTRGRRIASSEGTAVRQWVGVECSECGSGGVGGECVVWSTAF